MMSKEQQESQDLAAFYDQEGVLGQIEEEPFEFSLEEELRDQIISGTRRRRLKNVSIKLDAVQVVALKKIATQKSIPYQTLIRVWLAEGLRRELFQQR